MRFCSNPCPATKKFIFEKYQGICQYCGNSGNTIDHIIPCNVFNTNNKKDNLVLACRICNSMMSRLSYDMLEDKKKFIKNNIRRVMYLRKKHGLDVMQEWNKNKEIFEIKNGRKIFWSSKI